MTPSLRFCLVLHNHQPIGNFDGVFEQAYQDSYLPFLDVFEDYSDLRISLHTSGPLAEWLDEHHGEYLDRVAALVAAGRIEVLGGPYSEPILTMIPSRDRRGQITEYTSWLQNRLGGTVQGMWAPERVWEQNLVSDLAAAGMRYLVLDDFHFKNAGLRTDQLHGYYLSEDDGNIINIFPGSERLRYLIPFGPPHETIDYLRGIAESHPEAVVVFGDDGEKFGTWPDTKQHVYDNGWLRQFFDALCENKQWLHTTTLAEAVDNVPAEGKIYLPDASYREMTEWSLPVDSQIEYDEITHELHHDPRWDRISLFLRGGNWRNFKVKYPEANEMYARMMMVSNRLAKAAANPRTDQQLLAYARRELYQGQCNCSYWHGAFGGIYLPHLRNAVYQRLIAADNLLDQAEGKTGSFVESSTFDYNFDARQEVQLTNDKLVALLTPAVGGHLVELDVRSICHNLLATITRQPEAYHRKVLAGANAGGEHVASIHDRVVFKQEGLDQRLQYDRFPKKSLVDHFFDPEASLAAMFQGEAEEKGDFAKGIYEARVRKNPDRNIQAQFTRTGTAAGFPVTITKGVTLSAGSNALEIAYRLEGLPKDKPLHFAIEFNFSGLPSGADDRYFHQGENRLGQLGQQLDLRDVRELALTDEWLGIDVGFSSNRPTNLWTFPIETVSQSEGGFELVHQSVCFVPHWIVQGDEHGRWSVVMTLGLDTTLAESRQECAAEAVGS